MTSSASANGSASLPASWKSQAPSPLLIPGYAAFAALWLACTMVGAIIAHLVVLPTPVAPAAVLLALTGTLAWLRRDQILSVLGRRR